MTALSPLSLDLGGRAVRGPLLLPDLSTLPSPITAFTGPFAFLANDYSASFQFQAWGEAHDAPTLEHAFQALKASSLEEFQQVLACPTAQAAWEAGRRLELRADWDQVKIEVMRDLVGRKFAREDLAVRIEETGATPLVALNRWHDGYWGVCRCPACAGVGANVLGALLMWAREAAR